MLPAPPFGPDGRTRRRAHPYAETFNRRPAGLRTEIGTSTPPNGS